MDGSIADLGKITSRSLWEEAVRLSSRVPQRHSVDLPAVVDDFSSQEISCWRRNGANGDHVLLQMMPRVGGFPAALARYFIAAYSQPGDVICDPYCGKGTVLFEATRMGRHAFGGDTAPDAVVSTRAKCLPVSFGQVAGYVEALDLNRCEPLKSIPSDVRLFYHPETLRQIMSVRRQLLTDMTCRCARTRNAATFTCGIMLGLLHGHSRLSLSLPCNQCFAMSPAYVRRYVQKHRLERPRRDVRQCLIGRIMKLFPRPRVTGVAKVYQASAEDCPRYLRTARGEVALVLTSPPYLNRQTYSKDAWLRLWFLGYDHRAVARQSLETGSIRVFVRAMEKSLGAVMTCIKPGGRLVLVGGQARASLGGEDRYVRINDLCLYALDRMKGTSKLSIVEAAIQDSKVMNRGSYFAVHGGKRQLAGGGVGPRYGEEDILIVRKPA